MCLYIDPHEKETNSSSANFTSENNNLMHKLQGYFSLVGMHTSKRLGYPVEMHKQILNTK